MISFLLARATTSLGNSHNLDKEEGGGGWLVLGIPRFLMEAINPSFIPALRLLRDAPICPIRNEPVPA